MVLDDLSDPADLEGLWSESPAGRVLITTARAAALAEQRRALVLPVGPFSTREAMSYLMGRLATDPGQRLGAIDLAGELFGEPLALAQADPEDPPIAYVEGLMGDVYVEAGEEVDQFSLAWTHLVTQALDPAASAAMISALVKE